LTEKELDKSFDTLTRMAKVLKAETTKIATTVGAKGCCLRVLVRELRNDDYIDVRIAVAGNVDSGKSTLIGVLSRGQLDDGRGAMRQTVFNHPHEIETGSRGVLFVCSLGGMWLILFFRVGTSSISHQIIGFDIHGGIVNYKVSDVIG
jgi:GTPase